MNYQAHWRINFVALNGDKCRIDICTDKYEGEIVPLLGADSPITTDEDDSTDLFTPIRTQSGSLRIVNTNKDLNGGDFDHFELYPGSALERQVRLYCNDMLRWVGYIDVQALTKPLYTTIDILEYSLSCPLQTLYNIPFKVTCSGNADETFKSMGQLLHYCLKEVNDWEAVMKTNTVFGRQDLNAKVSLLNFVSKDEVQCNNVTAENPTATWESDITCGEVVDEICKYWGWTLSSRANMLYLLSPQSRLKIAYISFEKLPVITDDTLGSNTYYPMVNCEDLQFASTDHSVERVNGYREITITNDVNADEDIINPDLSKLQYDFIGVNGDKTQIIHADSSDKGPVNFVYGGLDDTKTGNPSKQKLENYILYNNRTHAVGYTVPFVLVEHDQWLSGTNKYAFKFKQSIACWKHGSVNSNYLQRRIFSLTTLENVVVPANSMICISGIAEKNVKPSLNESFDEDTKIPLPLMLRVGGMYYHGTYTKKGDNDNTYVYDGEWKNQASSIFANIRQGGEIDQNMQTLELYPECDGYCIPVTNTMVGRVEVAVLYAQDSGQPQDYTLDGIRYLIQNLRVSIHTKDDMLRPINKSSHEFKSEVTDIFKEELYVEISMASGVDNVAGLGQLYYGTKNNNPLTLINFDGTGDINIENEGRKPEQELLNKYVSVYGDVHTVYTWEVFDNVDADKPGTDVYADSEILPNGGKILCSSHDWANATMKIKISDKL